MPSIAPASSLPSRWAGLVIPNPYLIVFFALFLWRYTRFVVHVISWVTFKPIQRSAECKVLSSADVTVLIPTICGDDTSQLKETIMQAVRNRPYQIIVVTIRKDHAIIQAAAKSIDPKIVVSSVKIPNKRRQLAKAISMVQTPIVLHVDDDSLMSAHFINEILIPFADPTVGAVGTLQRVRGVPGLSLIGKIYEYLGACYIERRNFEITATSHIDGGVSCLSGRAAALRTSIVKDELFLDGYCTEQWRGRILNPDDDNFVTRWLVRHGWKIKIQTSPDALLETYLEANHKFWKQCLRWSRSNWRSNYTSTCVERYIWRKQPWSTYALHLATPTCSLINDPLLIYTLVKALQVDSEKILPACSIYTLVTWMLLAKITKLTPHFWRKPADLVYFPITLIFGYLHGLQKYYALLTVNESGWGTRSVEPDSQIVEADDMENQPLLSARVRTIHDGSTGRKPRIGEARRVSRTRGLGRL